MPIFVNETEIDDDTVFSEMQYHPADKMDEARDAAAQALVIRELLRQEADRQGMADLANENEDALDTVLMTLVEKEVAVPAATSDYCQTYYEQNKERFRASDASSAILPFNMVEDKIRDYLQTRSTREGIRSYILSLAQNARITGFDLASSL
jgi:hypothetical protein